MRIADKPGFDPTLPAVTLKIDGVEYHPVFDFNAIALVEQQTGINLLKSIVQDISAVHLRALLWASLLREHPEMTIEQTGELITMYNLAEVHSAMIAAWFGSVASDSKDDESPKTKARAKAKP